MKLIDKINAAKGDLRRLLSTTESTLLSMLEDTAERYGDDAPDISTRIRCKRAAEVLTLIYGGDTRHTPNFRSGSASQYNATLFNFLDELMRDRP